MKSASTIFVEGEAAFWVVGGTGIAIILFKKELEKEEKK
jgi:hypothetical protein